MVRSLRLYRHRRCSLSKALLVICCRRPRCLPSPSQGPSSGIDRTYPFFNITFTSTHDTPGAILPSDWGERDRQFDATMYLMWDPGTGPADCHTASTDPDTRVQTSSNCTSIPIPLGSVEWKWNTCGINTLSVQPGGTTWLKNCAKNRLFQAQAANGFPTWSGIAQ